MAAAIILAWGVRRLLLRGFGRRPDVAEPSYLRRFVAATIDGLARGLLPAAMAMVVHGAVQAENSPFTGLLQTLLLNLTVGLALFFPAMAVPRAILAPDLPAWRLTTLTPRNARLIHRLVFWTMAVAAFDGVVSTTLEAESIVPALPFVSVYEFLTKTAIGLLIITLTSRRLWRERLIIETETDENVRQEPEAGRLWPLLRTLAALVALVGIGAMLVGYVLLGSYLISSLALSGVVIAALLLVRGILRELIGFLTRSTLMVELLDLSYHTRRAIKFWVRAILDPALATVAVVVLLPVWGVPRDLLGVWVLDFLTGFTVGSITISPVDVLLAVGVFIFVLVASRSLQRTLSGKVLSDLDLSPGVQNSLAAGVGYIGIVIAGALALAVIGVDATNFALIAGALGVGIGFGLQNIVNNFVSGLILLVERPIRIDDWVVVGKDEGFVKKINIRATQIETWQRATVVIPNADLLSSNLVNWYLTDTVGRIEVPVRIAYGCDSARVRDILLQAANEHPKALMDPEPHVLMMGFGDAGLEMELRFFTGDIAWKLFIASDIRFQIDRKFREEGIQIPYPQRVVRMVEAEHPHLDGKSAPPTDQPPPA